MKTTTAVQIRASAGPSFTINTVEEGFFLMKFKRGWWRCPLDPQAAASVGQVLSVIDEMQKSPIEKRKRNLKTISPHSRGEREIWIPFNQFREEKEKSKFLCLVSRGEREISNFLAQFREEKEKPEFLFPVSRGEREISNSFAQFREEKEKLANISNFREEKFKTKFLYGYIHLRE